MTTPDLAHEDILEGIGFNPRGNETQVYSVENSNLCLVGTAEITLGGLYAKQTFDSEELPVKLCGVSHCFRTEAGCRRTSIKRLISRPSIYKNRDVRLHAAGPERCGS